MKGIEIEMQPLRTLNFKSGELAEELDVSQRTLRSKERENSRLMRDIMYLRNRLSRCGSLLLNSEAKCEKEARRAAIAEAALKQLSLDHALAREHADSLNLLSKFNTNTTKGSQIKTTTIDPYNYNTIPSPKQYQEKQQQYDEPSLQEQQLQQKVAALELALEEAFSTPTDQQTFHASDVAQLQQRVATCEAKLHSKTTDYDAVKAECDLCREQLNGADASLQQMTDAYFLASQKAEKLKKELELKEEVQNKLRAELLMEQQEHSRTQHELQMIASSPSPSATSSPRRRVSLREEAEEEGKQEETVSHHLGELASASEVLDLQHQLADRDAHIAKLLAVIEELRQGLEGELETMHGKTMEEGGLRLMKAMLEQERVSRQQLLDAYTDSKKRIKALMVQLDEARKEVSRMKSVMAGGGTLKIERFHS
jgi:DNA repair exonuclease SbcCD ATPase subunit